MLLRHTVDHGTECQASWLLITFTIFINKSIASHVKNKFEDDDDDDNDYEIKDIVNSHMTFHGIFPSNKSIR